MAKKHNFKDVEFEEPKKSRSRRDEEINEFTQRLADEVGSKWGPKVGQIVSENAERVAAFVTAQVTQRVATQLAQALHKMPMRVDSIENPKGQVKEEAFTLPEMMVALKYQNDHIIDCLEDVNKRLSDIEDELNIEDEEEDFEETEDDEE